MELAPSALWGLPGLLVRSLGAQRILLPHHLRLRLHLRSLSDWLLCEQSANVPHASQVNLRLLLLLGVVVVLVDDDADRGSRSDASNDEDNDDSGHAQDDLVAAAVNPL